MATMKNDPLSTREAAQLLGVAPSSVKRLADQGLLACVRTAGGHRRYQRASLEQFLEQQRVGRKPAPSSAWLERIVEARQLDTEAELLRTRARRGGWAEVADEVGAVLTDLGAAWECGDIAIADEHRASDCLGRALGRIGQSLPGTLDGPRCVLACAEGEEHTLGLSLAELCLRERGWTPLWLGRHTPTAEILRVLARGGVRAVALSASAAADGTAALEAMASRVAEACPHAGATLVLGGRGPWPEALPGVARLHSFVAFGQLLARLEGA